MSKERGPTISQETLDAFCAKVPISKRASAPRYSPWGLTLAEVQVMDCACIHGCTKSIANARKVSLNTVADQLRAIYQKLGVHHMAVAVAMFVLWRHTEDGKGVAC